MSYEKKLERYLEIADLTLLRPIDSEEQYERVFEVVTNLMHRTNRPPEEDDYLLMLSLVIEDYENQHYTVDVSVDSVLDTLKYLLGESGMTGSDLGHLLGNRTLGEKILRGERDLSTKHIGLLSKHFKVSPSLFFEQQ